MPWLPGCCRLPPAGIFPLSADGFEQLQAAMERLTLNDASGKPRAAWCLRSTTGGATFWGGMQARLAKQAAASIQLPACLPACLLAASPLSACSGGAAGEQQRAGGRLPLRLPGTAAHGCELRREQYAAVSVLHQCFSPCSTSFSFSPHSPMCLPPCPALPFPQVFRQRLEQEHGASVIVTAPTVPCRVVLPGGDTLELQNPAEFPLNVKIAEGGWQARQEARTKSPPTLVGSLGCSAWSSPTGAPARRQGLSAAWCFQCCSLASTAATIAAATAHTRRRPSLAQCGSPRWLPPS